MELNGRCHKLRYSRTHVLLQDIKNTGRRAVAAVAGKAAFCKDYFV